MLGFRSDVVREFALHLGKSRLRKVTIGVISEVTGLCAVDVATLLADGLCGDSHLEEFTVCARHKEVSNVYCSSCNVIHCLVYFNCCLKYEQW